MIQRAALASISVLPHLAWPSAAPAAALAKMTKVNLSPDPEGYLFSISSFRYIAPHGSISESKDFSFSKPTPFSLVTVFSTGKDDREITVDWVRERVEKYKAIDDVFHEAFLSSVVFHGPHDVELTSQAEEYLASLGTSRILSKSSLGLLPGPYALVKQELREVWRLIDDSNGTCVTTLKPVKSSQPDSFDPLPLGSSDGQSLSFAVPSRIRTQAASDSPLAGFRVLIKDNIHLKGIKTSVGNRAFYETYPPRTESAECTQKIMDLGAVILGKTKLSSFGNWEEPTEYIDYQAPWNPRGDRYQSPGGSSSGSAAAIATYDWLDIAIGTDTWGSVTRPAHWCGCFGLRPSFNAVSAKGIEPYVGSWDVPGILARDLQKCKEFANQWLDTDALNVDSKPFSSVIWPVDFWNIIKSEQNDIARGFADAMAADLGVKLEQVSFESAWEKSSPPEANGLSLPEFICPATAALAYDVYHNSDDFRARHWDLFNMAPYTTRQNERLWSVGKTLSKAERDDGFARIALYSNWFRNTVLAGVHANALVILPLESTGPRYRDEFPDFKRPPQDGINALALAPVVKSPVLSVPIAEIPYHSSVTQREEKLPFSVAIMSSPGTDLTLINTTIDILKKLGIPTILRTGSSMYD